MHYPYQTDSQGELPQRTRSKPGSPKAQDVAEGFNILLPAVSAQERAQGGNNA